MSMNNSYDSFLDTLAFRESTNNPQAINTKGYLGLYQMGRLALADAGMIVDDKKKGNNYKTYKWTDKAKKLGINNYQDFLDNPAAQKAAVSDYHDKLRGYLENNGAIDRVGDTYDGAMITEEGLLGAAHLVGAGGVKEWLDGDTTVADGYGTSPAEYVQLLGSTEPSAAQPTEDYSFYLDEDYSDLAELELAAQKAIEEAMIDLPEVEELNDYYIDDPNISAFDQEDRDALQGIIDQLTKESLGD